MTVVKQTNVEGTPRLCGFMAAAIIIIFILYKLNFHLTIHEMCNPLRSIGLILLILLECIL